MQVVDVHKKNLNALGYTSLDEWITTDPSHLYVGRQNAWVAGAKRSKWANPFNSKKHGLRECIELYKNHIEGGSLSSDLHELEGKTLGCWCVNDDCSELRLDNITCHAQILVLLSRKSKHATY